MAHYQQPASDSEAQKRNPFDNILADDDEFGDFTSAVSSTHSTKSSFLSAPCLSTVTANGGVFFNRLPPAPQDEIEKDDEFGDFFAQTSVRLEKTVVPAVKCQSNYSIGQEIDSCLSWNEPSLVISATVQQQKSEDEIEEEEFGQFKSAPEPPTEAPVDLFDSQAASGWDLFSSINDVDSLLILEPTLTAEAAFQVADFAVEDEFRNFEQAIINKEPLDLVVPVVLFNPVKETHEPQPTKEDHSSVHDISEIIVDTVPVEPSPQPQIPLEEEDDFGDFAEFQQATEQVLVGQKDGDDDEEFDDFEVALPPPVALASVDGEEDIQLTPGTRLKRLLDTIFPYAEPKEAKSSPTCLSPLSSHDVLWSFVSQLDSTPAFSFQWRHSTVHQRFLNSLKIDSMQQQVNFGINIFLTIFCTDKFVLMNFRALHTRPNGTGLHQRIVLIRHL